MPVCKKRAQRYLVMLALPPDNYAGKEIHAGCLSFEMSIRHFAVVVNCGAFQGEDENWQRFARSTIAIPH